MALISHPQLRSMQRVVDLGVCTWIRKNTDGKVCGKIHNRCSAHLKSKSRPDALDDPCGNVAAVGLTICRYHGVNRNAKNAGTKRVAAQRARGELGQLLDACRVEVAGRSEVEQLDDLRERSAAMVLALDILLGEGANVEGVDPATYGEWIDRSSRVEKIAADMGLDRRRVTLDEERAHAIIKVIRGTLDALGIKFDDDRVPGIVAGQLRALEVGGAETP